jgi:membrane-associated protease RseP (regulator of RpoE activity)
LRFCRACGYRLGEGLEEYVETVRLKPRVSAEARPAGTNAAQGAQPPPFQAQAWGAMAAQQAADARRAAAQGSPKFSKMSCAGKRKGHWLLWMILAIVMISVVGGGLMSPFALKRRFGGAAGSSAAKQSYFGVKGFTKADGGGAFMDFAYPPGGPADKAGLVGGDVIISFDGQPVKSDVDIRRILSATTIGKTVDVVYLRDGQTRTTKLTTFSKEEFDRLDEAFNDKDKGYLKEGTDIDRVLIPGMNIYGARLNRISKSGPADMAGLKDGDIVIQFGETPIRTRRELEMRIERAEPYSTVTVVIVRDGQRMEIPVKVGPEP